MSKPTTLREITRMPYKAAALSPKWREFLGHVPADEQFSVLLAGPAGTGKSTLCMQLAKEFTRLGHVLYVCAEERTKTGTLRLRAKLLGISSSRIWLHDTVHYAEVCEQLDTGKYKFCVIDSIQEMDIEDEALMQILDRYPRVVFVFVAQVDWTEKQSRGSSKWRHKVDIRLWTEADDEDGCRYATNVKNRFAPVKSRLFLYCPSSSAVPAGGKSAETYETVKSHMRTRGKRLWKTSSRE
jgi:predicted ATP-dependent serine protease